MRMTTSRFATSLLAAALVASVPAGAAEDISSVKGSANSIISVQPITDFDEPWAMAVLPDGEMLVTEKRGKLFTVSQTGEKTEVGGVPEVDYGGQGGLGDVALHPEFTENGVVFLSYAEAGENGTRGAAVARAVLSREGDAPVLRDLEVIWRQQPKVSGRGHYSHRIAFSPDGGKLYITSGERQKGAPSQDMDKNLGKIIRLNADGSVPDDNPFQDDGDLAKTFWSIGHRNLLGLAFDDEDRLWQIEMGPRGGDELNLVEKGENYGWPAVSEGRKYSGGDIPDHSTRPEFKAPEEFWDPVISPSDLIIYSGDVFQDWYGNALISALSARALVRVELGEQDDGTMAREVERFDMGKRIREVEQGTDGAIWLLEDEAGGRLLKLMPDKID